MEPQQINSATIRSTARRRSAMRILIYLKGMGGQNPLPLPTGKISEALDLGWDTTKHNLVKLTECGFLEFVEDKMDRKLLHFQISNMPAVDTAIEIYETRVSYRLGRLIPYKRIYSKQLESDPRFLEKCEFYGLSFYAGLRVVISCPKISTLTPTDNYSGKSDGVFLWRNSEGYISPGEEQPEDERYVEDI